MILLLLAATLLACVFVKLLVPYPTPFHFNRTVMSDPFERPSCPPSVHNDFPTEYRTVFDKEGGMARGYPPTGGILLPPLDAAVAQHLDLSRQAPSIRAQNAADEDDFCTRLRLLGAKWWDSEDEYVRKSIGLDEATEGDKKEIVVGWPSNGRSVWILRLHDSDARPGDFGKLGMCVSMDERCAMLQTWGAIFYEDPKAVEEFGGLI